MYIVISMPNRKSVACGVSHFMTMLLSVAFSPILPSPRYLTEDEVGADKHGNPKIERRFPALHAYLEEGKARRLHKRYLCQHRSLWYGQEKRPPAPIVCTYLGRGDAKGGRPFRFILNC